MTKVVFKHQGNNVAVMVLEDIPRKGDFIGLVTSIEDQPTFFCVTAILRYYSGFKSSNWKLTSIVINLRSVTQAEMEFING